MSAFEADRFNHSRTSPRRESRGQIILSGSHKAVLATAKQLILVRQLGWLARVPSPAEPALLIYRPISPAAKEFLKNFRALAGQHARSDLHFVIQAGMVEYLEH
jgi:hypothetical protein